MITKLALIGFGEAAATFAGAGGWGASAHAYDIDARRAGAMAEAGVVAAPDAAHCLADATLVLSLVTADAALGAARAYAPLLAPGAIWCDLNSVAPATKRAAAAMIEAVGGAYVDGAVLAPVKPARLAVPLLLAGPAAEDARARLGGLGFSATRVIGAAIGAAAAVKMIRSVMVKGLEALTAEMLLAARAAGVEGEVLASLDASEQAMPWSDRAAYAIERMVTHGVRRAAEMEESAKTLEALGITPMMTRSTAAWQRAMAGRADALERTSG